jgi:hypothetical protein
MKLLEGFKPDETKMINRYKESMSKEEQAKAMTEEEREKRGHREISPSKLKRITSCLGSYAFIKRTPGLPVETPSKSALDGQKTGFLLEAYLNSKFTPRFEPIKEMVSVPEMKGCEEDRRKRIEEVHDYLTNWRKEIFEVYPDAEFFYFRQEEFFESWSIAEGIDGVGGSADIAIAWRHGKQVNLAVMDLKDGQSFVGSDSPQLVAYAAGLMHSLVKRGLALYSSFNFIHLHILQPKIENWSARIVQYNDIVQEIKDLKSKTLLAFELSKEDDETVKRYLEASPESCSFCPAKVACPALFKEVSNAFDVVTSEETPKSVPEAIRDLSVESKVKIVKYRKIIEDLTKQIRADFVKDLSHGGTIEGLKLVASKADQAVWSSAVLPEERKKKIVDAGGQAEEVVELSPAKVKKILGAKKFDSLDLIEMKSFGITVVAKEERGKEIDITKIDAKNAFEEIEETEQ